jgi:hypothetical protein
MLKARGRPSSAGLAVVGLAHSVPRPDVPLELTEEQAEEWRTVVNRLPADWFPPETHPLLVQYCREVVAARKVAQLIAAHEKKRGINVDYYDQLLKMQDRCSRAIMTLATKMRLSQQATIGKKVARKPELAQRPWEVDEEVEDEDQS